MATLLAILNSQLESLNSGRYRSMWLRTFTKVSCARSSASSRSRTMRKINEKTGRSYRRTSSRNAESRPCWASATTSASGRLVSSRWAGTGAGESYEKKQGTGNRELGTGDIDAPVPRSLPLAFTHMASSEDGATALNAASGGREKRDYVQRVFSEIAPRYDLLNHALSLNIDRAWRRRAIAMLDWRRNPAGLYVDLCAGTLDVAVMLAANPGFAGRVIRA